MGGKGATGDSFAVSLRFIYLAITVGLDGSETLHMDLCCNKSIIKDSTSMILYYIRLLMYAT